MFTSACMSLWRRGPLSDVLLDHSPPEFLRQSLSLSPELTDLPRLTGWRAPRSLQSLSPQHWDCKSRPPPSTLCSCWRHKLRSSHLHLNGAISRVPSLTALLCHHHHQLLTLLSNVYLCDWNAAFFSTISTSMHPGPKKESCRHSFPVETQRAPLHLLASLHLLLHSFSFVS